MNDKISSLRLFSRVAKSGSFTSAGEQSGLSQPSVSRIISKLEKDLGVALFVRSTHSLKLTEAGTDYLSKIDPILAALEEADHYVRGNGELRGHLRIGTATSFAIREIVPRLPPFLQRHPGLKVDLVMTDTFQDLIEEAIDVALRFGPLKDSTMVARPVTNITRIIAASPDYLEKVGKITHPTDLTKHKVILGPASTGPTGWTFTKNGKTTSVKVESQLMITVNEGATAAALAGMGIISTSAMSCRAELESGRLVRLLPEWDIGTVEVNAVLAGGRNAKASSRAFVSYLIQSFKENP